MNIDEKYYNYQPKEFKRLDNILYEKIEKYGFSIKKDIPFKECLFLYVNDIKESVKCKYCKKEDVRFKSFNKGYVDFCSNTCASEYKKLLSVDDKNEISNKRRNTNLVRYGYDNVAKSKIIQEKIKNTNLERYGVYFPLFNETVKNKKLLSNLNNWNGHPLSNKEKIKERCVNRKKTMSDKWEKSIIDRLDGYDVLYLDKDKREIKISCNNCGSEQICKHYTIVQRDGFLCYNCHPNKTSSYEKVISEWLKSLNVDVVEKDRSVLSGRELDVYIPCKNIAIEFNGLYWHSELFKDKKYHLNKSVLCQEKGIGLIHIWEDEWIFKQDIVKSIIMNRLDMIDDKIYARQCEVRVINDSKTIMNFLNDNHIQGYSQSSIRLGLYYNDELVSLMTFGKRMIKSNVEFELIRFCNKKFVNIVGAASKLFNYFKQHHAFDNIVSYSDFRIFSGEMYKKLGFIKQHLSSPEYFWCKNMKRNHRSIFMKHKLISEGYDSSKTEVEIMHSRGYYRIYGCGQYRWIYKNIK